MKIKWWQIALLIIIVLAVLSPIASTFPDGLERIAEGKGFADKAHESLFVVIPDYSFPGIQNETVSTIVAGLAGTLILFGIGYCLAALLKSKSKHEA